MFQKNFGIQWFFESAGSGGGAVEDQTARNLQSLLAKKDGDAMGVAAQLLAENAALRGDKRDLRKELDEVQAKLPAEDAVVLTGDEATRYNALTGLGTPDEIRKRLDNEAALVQKDSQAAKRASLDAAVKAAGYDPDAVAALNGALDLSFLVEKETRNGQPLEIAYIREGDQKRPAGEVLAEKYGQSVIDRLKLQHSAGGTRVALALGGDPAGRKGIEEVARAGQAGLYSGGNI